MGRYAHWALLCGKMGDVKTLWDTLNPSPNLLFKSIYKNECCWTKHDVVGGGCVRISAMTEEQKEELWTTLEAIWTEPDSTDGMGWDILWVLVSPPLKRLFKGPPPSFPGFHLLGWQGYSKEQSPPRSRVYRRVHTDRSDPITRFRFEKEDAQVHRRK